MRQKLIVIMLAGCFLFAQEPENYMSIHQLEQEAHADDYQGAILEKNTDKVHPLSKKISGETALNRAVFGYLPYWKRDTQELDLSALTHIAVFDFTVASDGHLERTPYGWPNDWITLMNRAHGRGVKIIMCITEFDANSIHSIINDSTHSANLYQDISAMMSDWQFDGVNIDFEAPYTEDRGSRMNHFIQGLSDYIHLHNGVQKEISFAGPAINWSGWDLAGLAEACDYIFIMGYNYYYSSSSYTGPCAPIYGSNYNLIQTLISNDKGYGLADPSKLILGLPYYGLRWQVSSSQKHVENTATQSGGTSIFYNTTMDLFKSAGKQWSDNYYDSWCYHSIGGKWYQSWCSDAKSMNAKFQLVEEYDLLGTGMWALGYDEGRQDLWNLLKRNFMVLPDTAILDNFSEGKGRFNYSPAYSGSTSGISTGSYTEVGLRQPGDSCLICVFKDDTEDDSNWRIRLLSGRGDPLNNQPLPRGRDIRFQLKTSSADSRLRCALSVDDIDGLEISDTLDIITDGQWHDYAVDCRPSAEWHSYAGGNGSLDAEFVTLDAIIFFSDNRTEDWTISLDNLMSAHLTDTLAFTVSGQITFGGQGLAGVTVGGSVSDSAGYYSVSTVYPQSLALRPQLEDYRFSPAVRNIALINRNMTCHFSASSAAVSAFSPDEFDLQANYPNPFNSATVIPFSLSRPAHIDISVFNSGGRLIREVLNRRMSAGRYDISVDLAGKPSGIYFCRLQVDGRRFIQKMCLIK